MIRASHAVVCPIGFILLYDLGWHGGVLKYNKKWPLVSIFGRYVPFSQDFRQVLAQIILSLVKIVRVCCIVACSILFVLL